MDSHYAFYTVYSVGAAGTKVQGLNGPPPRTSASWGVAQDVVKFAVGSDEPS